jgi:hypothetical protein
LSAGHSSEVDLDLLADYVGGALDGTGQEAAVARLIAGDPAWARAHAWLTRTGGDLRDVLAEWGRAPEPMPADVVERLTAALATAAPSDATAAPSDATAAPSDATAAPSDATAASLEVGAASLDVAAGPSSVSAEPRRTDAVVGGFRGAERPERGARPPSRPDGSAARPPGRTTGLTARRRMPRWATPVAVVAALVALAGLGVTYLAGDDRAVVSGTAGDSAEGGAGAPASGTAPSQPFAASPPVRLMATGTDYTRTSLADQVNRLRRAEEDMTAKGSGPSAPERAGNAPAPTSGAAGDQRGISACVAAIAAEHGRGALRVEWMDSASFEGTPALVVVFADATGERWAWVVSPNCGLPQVGAATRYSARVG